MINYFLQNENGSITYGNWPISENGVDAIPFEVTEEQIELVKDGTKDWSITEGVLSLIDSDRKAKIESEKIAIEQAIIDTRLRKIELIKKVTSGTATIDEQEEFANLL